MKNSLKLFFLPVLIASSGLNFASDTDGDGLPDDWEAANGRNPNLADYQVSAGEFHSCAIDDEGVSCWSKIDPPTQFSINSDVGQIDVPSLENPTRVSAGRNRSCAVDDTGVVCWGKLAGSENYGPKLLNPTELAVATDGTSVCAIDDSGVVCWGQGNAYGQISPPALTNPRSLTAGNVHFCAIGDEGAQCWGGSSGNDYTDMSSLSNTTYISAGVGSTCAIDDSGLVCFGYINNWDIPTLSNPLIVEVGGSNACAIDDTGVQCWGTSSYSGSLLLEVPRLLNPSNLTISKTGTLGHHHACSLTDRGVICWGHNLVGQTNVPVLLFDPDGDGYDNQSGQDAFPLNSGEWIDTDLDGIGNNSDVDDDGDNVIDSSDPWPLDRRYSSDADDDGLPDSYELTNGNDPNDSSDVAKDLDGDGLTILQEFGYGTSDSRSDSDFDTLPDSWERDNDRNPSVPDYAFSVGLLGNYVCVVDDIDLKCIGNAQLSSQTSNIPALINPHDVAASSVHVCAIDDTGAVCWGSNAGRTINDGLINPPDLIKPEKISVGWWHTCVIDNGGVVCWGNNDSGQIDVPNLVNPFDISSKDDRTCAIDDNGITCWGSLLNVETPNLVNPSSVSVGKTHVCVVDDTGVVCWGANVSGESNVPSNLINPVSVFAGDHSTCAVDDTGVICWGDNRFGQIDVPELINPSAIRMGDNQVCALESRGIVCWGKNANPLAELMIDPDGDSYTNQSGLDAFPFDSTEWLDTDIDGFGNNSDTDDDGDSVLDIADAFPLDPSESLDTDGDGFGDNADLFPNDASETVDSDIDGVGDNSDNCVNMVNTDQMNSDGDLLGNVCDDDDDNDGLSDQYDIFPLDAAEQVDSDGDGVGDNGDAFPLDITETLDTDSDGTGNNSDSDDDGDGVDDTNDVYPLESLYSADSDDDGMPDAWEIRYGLDSNDESDATSDQDNDGISAYEEFLAGTIPVGSLDIDGNGQYDALTDGLLLLRGMFGLTGTALVDGAVAADAVYVSGEAIKGRLDMLGDVIDIDGNSANDALTDGLVILRYLFGLRGDVLVDGVIASDALIQSAEGVGEKIDDLMPAIQIHKCILTVVSWYWNRGLVSAEAL